MPPSSEPRSAPPQGARNGGGWIATGRHMADPGSAMSAAIDLEQPRHGITIALPDAAMCSLLGLDMRSECRLADHWLRGGDVTAVYESTDARHLRTTAMWRLAPSDGATRAWELVVSAQTSLLQTMAALPVVSQVDATDVLWGTSEGRAVHWHADRPPEPHCVLLRCGGSAGSAGTSVLVATHPAEAGRMTIRAEGRRFSVECWLFATALEKGVLLRSRVLAAIGPAGDATRWAGDATASFNASPPMLTT